MKIDWAQGRAEDTLQLSLWHSHEMKLDALRPPVLPSLALYSSEYKPNFAMAGGQQHSVILFSFDKNEKPREPA